MKKISALPLLAVIICIVTVLSGCSNTVDDKYKTPSKSFKGLKFECVSKGDTTARIRNQMVYYDFCDFVKEDLNSKGNKITSIEVKSADGKVFHSNQTVANMTVNIEAESGDIKSGKYHIAAYFVYNVKDETNAKMYLINYCFVSGSKIDTSLFEESYSIIKDKTIP